MSTKRLFNIILVMALSTIAFANSRLHDLNINVVLSKSGDAHITETRRMTVGSEGTECYIVIGDLNGSKVEDFSVKDETGRRYENTLYWNVDWKREYKTGKCGIVEKGGGYELCWGIGESGERTYTTTYTITNLLKAYNESDGFNWMFVAEDVQPYPEHVLLTISAADSTMFTDSIANIWAFRYGGDVQFVDGCIVAESTEPFTEHDAMVVMVEFAKGIFSPTMNTGEQFEAVKQRAFEDSDYLTEPSKEDNNPWWMTWLTWIGGIGMGFLALVGLVGDPIERCYKKWKYGRNVEWYREIPMDGNLTRANDILNHLNGKLIDYDKLLSACLVKLINMGALGIENHPDKKGKIEPAYVVKKWTADEGMGPDDQKLLHGIYTIFDRAAGDKVLEPWELKEFMEDERNESVVFPFLRMLHSAHLVYLSKEKENIRQLLGLKKYLEDFTLLDERGVQEITLWKDYMVWATLFGCASTVIKEMQKINPEFFKMDNIARQMSEGISIPDMHKVFTKSADHIYYSRMSSSESDSGGSHRRSGGGGRASRSGGGGHSGGGHGGGIR